MITLAIVNARVWTGNPQRPWASGIAVQDDKIIAVGSSAEVAKIVTEATTVIDAKGRTVRNPAGNIERGGRAEFVIFSGDVPRADASHVILKVSGGKVLVNETG
ncbi:MAG: hypothetical protein ACRD3J_26965 [Thermoanaerobaculia bacterium]